MVRAPAFWRIAQPDMKGQSTRIGNVEELSYNVVVVGGGLAGVCAALAAARLGTRVALVQDRPVLGGNSSSEIRVVPLGAGRLNPWANESGIIHELLVDDRKRNHAVCNTTWDLILYDAVQREPNLELFLNTSVRSARMSAEGRIDAAIGFQLSTERDFAFRARYFVDAGGDGMFAASAGAAFRIGREGQQEFGESLAPKESDEATLPSSLLLISRDVGHPVVFEPPPWIEEFATEESLRYRDHEYYKHRSPASAFWWLELGGLYYDTIGDNEEIRHQLVRHLLGVWDHIKNRGDHGAETHVLEWFGWLPGKRESRRFEGDYMLTETDLRQRRLFRDRVAYGGWFFDEHTMGGILSPDRPPEPRVVDPDWAEKLALRPYSIPFRSLYSRNIRNLLLAGRNISASHIANGSIRVMKTCGVVGEAVGTAAYLCTTLGMDPCELCLTHIDGLQQLLIRNDCYIPGVRNQDPADLARSAAVRASSQAPLSFPKGDEAVELVWPSAQLFPVSSDRIDAIELWLSSSLDEPASVTATLRRAPDVWTLAPSELVARSEALVPSGTATWARFPIEREVEPGRLYWIEVDPCPGVSWSYSRDKSSVPVGTTSAVRRPGSTHWRLYEDLTEARGCFSLRIEPVQWPYDAENATSGLARPEQWTNIWISDSAQQFPQDLELHWDDVVRFNRVQFTFDTNLNRTPAKTPALTRYPECVSTYQLDYLDQGEWKPIVSVTGNYQRRREHRFSRVEAAAARLRVRATNGSRSARVYEMRVYDEA
jgi:hypothetical protein